MDEVLHLISKRNIEKIMKQEDQRFLDYIRNPLKIKMDVVSFHDDPEELRRILAELKLQEISNG